MSTTTFSSAPSFTSQASLWTSALLFALTHCGSDAILMTGFCGGVPSSTTLPVMVAAVEASTFLASGAGAGTEGADDLCEQAPIAVISATVAIALETRNITFHEYHAPDASRSLRMIRSWIQC